jgi:hypothetical protein
MTDVPGGAEQAMKESIMLSRMVHNFTFMNCVFLEISLSYPDYDDHVDKGRLSTKGDHGDSHRDHCDGIQHGRVTVYCQGAGEAVDRDD